MIKALTCMLILIHLSFEVNGQRVPRILPQVRQQNNLFRGRQFMIRRHLRRKINQQDYKTNPEIIQSDTAVLRSKQKVSKP